MSKDLCVVCGKGKLQTTREMRRYGRGVDVTLVNVPVRRCPECGEEFLVIPAIEELHRLIAHNVARLSVRLEPGQIRFLRTWLGYSSADFAGLMGVTPETVSRWEKKQDCQPMALPAERFLRLLALQDKPIESYGLEAAGAGERSTPVPLRLRPTAAGWATA